MTEPLALIVEDDYDISLMFARALRFVGYETQVLRTGDAALAWLLSTSFVPFLVILDLQLPGVSGDVILRNIRSADHLRDVRVVIATAFPAIAEELRQIADWVLIKPVGYDQLKNLARHFLEESERETSGSAVA